MKPEPTTPPAGVNIVYLATHGFSVRMIFQTGLLRRLTEAGKTVAVIVPDGEDPNLLALCARDGVRLVEYPVPRQPIQRLLKTLRKYVVEDIRNNPCLWDKHQENLRNAKSTWRRLIAGTGLLLNDVVDRLPFLRRLYLRAESKILLRPEVVSFVRTLRPELMVATYPVTPPEPELLLAAQHLGIRTVLHLLSWDNITAKGHFQALADAYIAWGPTMKEELAEHYGIRPADVTECGVPHFDLYFRPPVAVPDSALLSTLAADSGPYLFMAMSAARYAPEETAILEQLCGETLTGGRLEGLRIVARPHPSALSGVLQDTRTLDRLRRLERDNGLLISTPLMVSGSRMNWSVRDHDMHELVALLRGAAVVINSGSTVMVEALALGRPVVVTAYDGPQQYPYAQSARRLMDYPHLRKLVADGGGEVVADHAGLVAALAAFRDHPDRNRKARDHALYRQIGAQQGEATERVAAVLEKEWGRTR